MKNTRKAWSFSLENTTFFPARILLSMVLAFCVLLALTGLHQYGNIALTRLGEVAGPRLLAAWLLEKFGPGRTSIQTIASGYLVINAAVVVAVAMLGLKGLRQAKATRHRYDQAIGNYVVYAFIGFMALACVAVGSAFVGINTPNVMFLPSNVVIMGLSALCALIFAFLALVPFMLSHNSNSGGHYANPFPVLCYVTYGPAVFIATLAYSPGNIALAVSVLYLLRSTKPIREQIAKS